MNTHDIELPPIPDEGIPFRYDSAWGAWEQVAKEYAESDGVVKFYSEDQVRAAIEADRKRKGEVVVTKTPEGEIIAVTRQDDEGRILSVIDEADSKRRGEPVLVGWTASTTGGGILHASKYTEYEAKRSGYSLPVYRLTSPQPAEPDKQHPDDVAVDAFAAAMKAKLKRAREEKGRGGWQDMSATELSAMLREHVEKGDPVDVANLAMMLSLNGQRIVPAEPVKVSSEADAKHVQDFINCDGMGAVIVEGPQYSAVVRALLDRYGKGTP